MSLENFDFGAELEQGSGGFKRENPAEGLHIARLRSIIHLGKCVTIYKGKPKPPANKAVAIFELKEDGDVHSETGEPLTFAQEFNLMDGDKSFLNKSLIPALVTKEDLASGAVKGFDDLIGRCCQLDLTGSKQRNEDGTPKYINLKSISAAHPKIIAITDELAVQGVGHCRLGQLTLEAMEELNPFLHVQMGMMTSVEWEAGTHPAIALVEEIRKERPNYAKAKSDDDKPAEIGTGASQPPAQPVEELSENEEF